LILIALVSEATYFFSGSGYESRVTLAWSTRAGLRDSAQAGSPRTPAEYLLSLASGRTEAMPLVDRSTTSSRFRVSLLGNGVAQLVCWTENRAIVQPVCSEAAGDAAKLYHDVRVVTPATAAARVRGSVFPAIWAALTAGMIWFIIRSMGKRGALSAAGRDDALLGGPDAARWSRPSQHMHGAPAAPIAPMIVPRPEPMRRDSFAPPPPVAPANMRRAPQNTPRGIKTDMGMPGVRATPMAGTAAGVIVDPRAYEPHEGSTPVQGVPAGAGLAVLHPGSNVVHVPNFAWSYDPNILTIEALNQLRLLRDNLRAHSEAGCRVVRIASDWGSRHAKSQVAAQLACMLAERNQMHVLLMEADRDTPVLHTMLHLNVPRGAGLSDQLNRMAQFETSSAATTLRLGSTLYALAESQWGTPSLLDSPQFTNVLQQQLHEHDVIIIDGPVLDFWPDAKMLSDVHDAVFVVAAGTDSVEATRIAAQHFGPDRILALVHTGANAPD
jgi:Mrp family chromosome partitioning ATPase